jgi:hypothetical protein
MWGEQKVVEPDRPQMPFACLITKGKIKKKHTHSEYFHIKDGLRERASMLRLHILPVLFIQPPPPPHKEGNSGSVYALCWHVVWVLCYVTAKDTLATKPRNLEWTTTTGVGMRSARESIGTYEERVFCMGVKLCRSH